MSLGLCDSSCFPHAAGLRQVRKWDIVAPYLGMHEYWCPWEWMTHPKAAIECKTGNGVCIEEGVGPFCSTSLSSFFVLVCFAFVSFAFLWLLSIVTGRQRSNEIICYRWKISVECKWSWHLPCFAPLAVIQCQFPPQGSASSSQTFQKSFSNPAESCIRLETRYERNWNMHMQRKYALLYGFWRQTHLVYLQIHLAKFSMKWSILHEENKAFTTFVDHVS